VGDNHLRLLRVNKAAQTLGRMAKGKSKTMTKAAMRQRKHAAQASAVARRKKAKEKCLTSENALVE